MTQLFFQGYGWWIFKHAKAQLKFLIKPLSSFDYNESSYRNNFLLYPYSEGEDGIIGESSFRMQGFFDLTRNDAFAYKQLGSDFEPDRKLLPCYTDDGTIYRSGSAFEIFDQLEPWGLWIKEEDCHFIIDKKRRFKFKIEDPEIADKPANIVTTAEAEQPFNSGNKKLKEKSESISTVMSIIGKAGAEKRHSQPGGSRDKAEKMREIWATGKYSSRDICAEQECAGLNISFSTARKALRNTPDQQ